LPCAVPEGDPIKPLDDTPSPLLGCQTLHRFNYPNTPIPALELVGRHSRQALPGAPTFEATPPVASKIYEALAACLSHATVLATGKLPSHCPQPPSLGCLRHIGRLLSEASRARPSCIGWVSAAGTTWVSWVPAQLRLPCRVCG